MGSVFCPKNKQTKIKDGVEITAKEIVPLDIEKEPKQSYLDYAMSVIVGRALPDARDGFKPVHRRVYTLRMY